jgi:hypothetical protein
MALWMKKEDGTLVDVSGGGGGGTFDGEHVPTGDPTDPATLDIVDEGQLLWDGVESDGGSGAKFISETVVVPANPGVSYSSVEVTFPEPFDALPNITLTVQSGSAVYAEAANTTTTGFECIVRSTSALNRDAADVSDRAINRDYSVWYQATDDSTISRFGGGSGGGSEPHDHAEYAPVEHDHAEYAPVEHDHAEYAPVEHDHDEYVDSPPAPTSGNGLVWDGSTWVDEKLLRADGSNTFDGAKLLVPADFAIESQTGTPRSLEFDSEGSTRMSVNGIPYMEWSGLAVRVTAEHGIRSSHLGQYTSTMGVSTANRVTDYGQYTYDGTSSTGYGPSISFSGTFTGNPIVVATVQENTAGANRGYYVKINNLSTTSVRFRHYAVDGFWGDGTSATVHWIAMGIRATGTREHDELESTDFATGVVEPEELEGA